jgi:hypothetical protein
MEKIVKDGKDWFSIKDFMERHKIKSNATVYAMCKDKRASMSQFMGKRIFSMN